MNEKVRKKRSHAAQDNPAEARIETPAAEGQQYEKLTALIRGLYREKQAEEIIASFDSVFKAHTESRERHEILTYWLDFYRLQEYRKGKQRRRPTRKERMTACAACGYPSSHRHHLWDFATHGENRVTIQLCANCHELHHLMYNALVKGSDYSRDILHHVMFSSAASLAPETIVRILGWCLATIRYEANNGWIDGESGSKGHVDERLRWTEFLREVQPKMVS